MPGKRFSTWLLTAMLLATPTGAGATTYVVDSGFLDVADGCPDATCASPSLALSVPVALGGTIEITDGFMDIDVGLSALSNVVLDGVAGGPDDGETATFSSLSFSAIGLSAMSVPGFIAIDAGQTASVSGTLDGAPFTAAGVAVSGTCAEAAGFLTCGFTFGESGFALGTGDGDTRWFAMTLDPVASVPEPATAVMAATGMLALVALRRRELRG